MESKTLLTALRGTAVLNLVVSTEPLDVVHLLYKMLGRLSDMGNLRVATRFGVVDVRQYLQGATMVGWSNRIAGLVEKTDLDTLADVLKNRPADPALGKGMHHWCGKVPEKGAALIEKTDHELFTEMAGQDPKNQQFFYIMPDLWPSLSDPRVLADLMRVKDEREADPRTIKMVIVIAPTLESLPEPFRRHFEIHYDNGLTEAQVLEELTGKAGIFSYIFNTPLSPEVIAPIAKLGTGLGTSQLARMVAHSIILQRKKDWKTNFTMEGMAEWRKAHGYPEVIMKDKNAR
jgi:hypothetical protein